MSDSKTALATALYDADTVLLSAHGRQSDYERWSDAIVAALPDDAYLFTVDSLAAALLATYNERHGKALHPSPLTESRAIIGAAKEAERD